VSQTDSDQQLRIWKDLAIGKQLLMNEAASALKLDDDFSADDLREALNHAVKRARDADADIAAARNRASEEVANMQAAVKKVEKAKKEADAQRDAALEAQRSAEASLETGRQDNAESVKKAKRQVEDSKRELKAINVALADTPENTVKKLKQLKAQKIEEANARKQAEEANRKLKKDSKELKDELDTLSGLKEQTARLLAAYRELVEWSDAASAKDDTLDEAPKAEAKLLSDIETVTAAADEEEDNGKKKKSDKREALTA